MEQRYPLNPCYSDVYSSLNYNSEPKPEVLNVVDSLEEEFHSIPLRIVRHLPFDWRSLSKLENGQNIPKENVFVLMTTARARAHGRAREEKTRSKQHRSLMPFKKTFIFVPHIFFTNRRKLTNQREE